MQDAPLTPELKCDDYEKSLEFYQDILGFNILYKREDHGFAMMEFEGACLMIDRDDQFFRDLYPDTEKPYGRGVNFQIKTKDISALLERVKKVNWPITYEMEDVWYRANDVELGNRQFSVQDPDGYILRFFENLGKRPVEA